MRVRLVSWAISWHYPNQNNCRINQNLPIVNWDTFLLPKCLRERLWIGLILSPSGRWRKRLKSLRVPPGTAIHKMWSSKLCPCSKVSPPHLSSIARFYVNHSHCHCFTHYIVYIFAVTYLLCITIIFLLASDNGYSKVTSGVKTLIYWNSRVLPNTYANLLTCTYQ